MIRIASWNIGEDEQNEQNIVNLDSYNYIKNMISTNDIDIICFQENITSSEKIISISQFLKENSELIYNCDFELSESHINIGSMMGVTICSKFPISKEEKILFSNPNLTFKKNENRTYISQDKGFVIAYFNDIPLVIACGHCLPFHIFKKKPTDFLEVFKEMEYKFLDVFNSNSNFIVVGDMNYSKVEEIFPTIVKKTNQSVFGNTYKETQIDHILVSKNIKILNDKIIETRFDHNLCISDLEI